jgi:hypothetical protein
MHWLVMNWNALIATFAVSPQPAVARDSGSLYPSGSLQTIDLTLVDDP